MLRLLLAALAGLALAAPARANTSPPPPNTVFCLNVGTPDMACFADPGTVGGTAILTTSPQFAAYIAAQGVAQQLAGGVQIVSTGTPALNGTYAATGDAFQAIFVDWSLCNANKTFPGGKTANATLLDTSGVAHTVPNCAAMANLGTAIMTALFQTQQGQAVTMPITIP